MSTGLCRSVAPLAWLALAFALGAGIAQAQQTGAVVLNGQVSMNRQGNLLSITNTPGSIIQWQQFSIGRNETVRFIQASAQSSVLNRVVGSDPTLILGMLQSNGRVFIINPNGIVFGAGAQIDVAALVASTLNLSNGDFLANRLRFTETPGAGGLRNDATITTSTGGSVYLIAPDVQNTGVITSPQGEVILAAGRSVELVSPGTPNLRVEITAPDNQALNVGQIMADSGRVGIYAGLIRNSGSIRADGVVVGQGGEILLRATRSISMDGGTLSAGSIQINADEVIPAPGVAIQVPTAVTLDTTLIVGGNNVVTTGGNFTLIAPAGFLGAFVSKAVEIARSMVAIGGPAGSFVPTGLVTFNQQGTLLTTTNSPGSVINWQQFSIGANATTQFIQQSGSATVLNRVIGADPSIILGSLQSNGNVVVTNQSGLVLNGSGGTPVTVAATLAAP